MKGENAVTVGQRLLNKFGGLTGLHCAPFADIKKQHGLSGAKAAQIKAAIELGRRLTLEIPEERSAINSPADAAALVSYEMSSLEQEYLRVMLLDRSNRVLETVEVYKGSVNSSQIRVGGLAQALEVQQVSWCRWGKATTGKSIIRPAHRNGGMMTIPQTNNEIRVCTPPDANHFDLLTTEWVVRMKDGDKSRRGLGRTGSLLWVFHPGQTSYCKR